MSAVAASIAAAESEVSSEYELLRSSRRKTLSIQVRDGQVVVRAPLRVSQAAIDAFVRSRSGWISKHRQRQQQELATLGVRIEQGGKVPWQGEMLGLHWQRGASSRVEPVGDHLQLTGFQVTLSHRIRRTEADVVSDQLKGWFIQQAERRLKPRTLELAQITGLQPTAVEIGNWRGRWGQCSSRGEVKLNWRLLQLAPQLQDYVIVHELCHLKHMNHGPQFHALLQHHCAEHPHLHTETQRYTPWLKW